VRILLVEDEPNVALGVRRALAAEGFDVDVARDGASGLRKASTGAYGLIVLDIMLPRMNGYQVCRRLRDEGNWTRILMLTAKSGEWDEAEALDTGADDYLVKPFSMVVLLARVRALLRRPRPAGPEPFVVGELRLDPHRHRCWRGEVEIELTAREMEVLWYLFERVGQVVTKSELLDHIWGDDRGGDPNSVEVFIRRLRKKLDEPFGAHDIETVRGVGYRLADLREAS
jgi:DNA-binding response OmpR family regulator